MRFPVGVQASACVFGWGSGFSLYPPTIDYSVQTAIFSLLINCSGSSHHDLVFELFNGNGCLQNDRCLFGEQLGESAKR